MDLVLGSNPIASWMFTIAVLLVVVIVVSVLLTLILKTAREINSEVSVVWNNGQRVANNTIHIASLYPIGKSIAKILNKAQEISDSTGHIHKHTATCNSCPNCIWTPRGN